MTEMHRSGVSERSTFDSYIASPVAMRAIFVLFEDA